MKKGWKLFMWLGIFCGLFSIAFCTVLRDPRLPIPVAIIGAGYFVGGAILASKS